jgi:hypothetical protein
MATILVLASILLPALAKARRQALALKSANNMKTIVQAVNVWAASNGSKYPKSVAVVTHRDGSWNWFEPFTLTSPEIGRFHAPHRAMSEYLRDSGVNAGIMFCTSAPKRPKHFKRAWDEGDAWDNPDTRGRHDAMYGNYCFYWDYDGWLSEERLFIGPRDLCGGRGQSNLLMTDYFGYDYWLNGSRYGGKTTAYGSCEHFRGANVTPARPGDFPANSAFWSRPKTDSFNRSTITVKPRAAYVDGHVESFSPATAVPMRVINMDDTDPPYHIRKGVFYLPPGALR